MVTVVIIAVVIKGRHWDIPKKVEGWFGGYERRTGIYQTIDWSQCPNDDVNGWWDVTRNRITDELRIIQ